MTWKFWHKTSDQQTDLAPSVGSPVSGPVFRIIVADFYDNISNCGAPNLAAALGSCEGLQTEAYLENFDHSFLNLESRNIFDLIDTGQSILKRTQSDVIIWGYRDNDKIRLNFQNNTHYENNGNSFISLMDSFYIPSSVVDSPDSKIPAELLLLLYGAALSTVNNPSREYQIYKKYLLRKVVHQLSKIDSSQTLTEEYLPYILNFVGIIYLSLAYDSSYDGDLKIIRNIFEDALKLQSKILQPSHIGCIHYHLGQLYDCATRYITNHPTSYFKPAIKNYQNTQKYLSKYTYPYDYGYVCYKLSELYVSYWKQTEDIQALRDAVFQLREAEKVYTQILFPDFWGQIQGRLGYLLHNLGHLTQSREICELSIRAYKNQQKIITEKNDPKSWAQIQEKIGNIEYFLGRLQDDVSLIQEALSSFHDALYIYENAGMNAQIKQIKSDIDKAYQSLEKLKSSDEEE